MKERIGLALALVIVGAAVSAQTKVDQGRPGNQGPWPVTGAGGTVNITSDGGFIGTVSPVKCAVTILDGGGANQITTVGAAAVEVPGAPTYGRAYMNICNNAQNASTAVIKCRQDGVAPVFAAGNAGSVLLYGDCMTITVPPTTNAVRCIGSGAGLFVDSYECVPLGGVGP